MDLLVLGHGEAEYHLSTEKSWARWYMPVIPTKVGNVK
jgi:hypothetical protein